MKESVPIFFQELQDTISDTLSQIDGMEFQEDSWDHRDGGGGRTRVLSNGPVLERAGINYSEVYGERLPTSILEEFPEAKDSGFGATGISLVIHPRNPFVPTVHMNYRYFEAESIWWFGGGADLTPYYPFEEDVVHFHSTLKQACDRHDPDYYQRFKKWCDEYFYIEHREEPRGVGGIFFDYLQEDFDSLFAFVQDCGESFLPAFKPILLRRKDTEYSTREREFQLYRRGRYAEFNLVYDRGTRFGLQTKGRIESILMSMPPIARWEYDYQPEPGSPEAELYEKYLEPREWVD